MDLLTAILDEATPYCAVAVIEPATPGWLHLPTLHAQLLPLALAIGHTRLVLRSEFGTGLGPLYEAYGAGGAAEFNAYVTMGLPGCLPAEFAQVLKQRLQAAVDKIALGYVQA